MEHGEWKEQLDLWSDFKQRLLYKNRFIKQHDVLDRITNIVNSSIIKLPKGTILYRARKYSEDLGFIKEFDEIIDKTIHPEKYQEDTSEENNALYKNLFRAMVEGERRRKRGYEERYRSGFWGYDENESFIPQNAEVIKDGRANPAKIRYLYVADDPKTALAEVRPLVDSYISIADIETSSELKIADLSYGIYESISKDDEMLVYLIMNEFSKPNNNEPFEYIPTQYISEYIKSLDFDGIKFNSSLYKRGRNYVIFNYEKCKAISSKLYQLNEICYDAKCVGPKGFLGDNDLSHWMLQPYKDACKNKFLEKLQSYKNVDVQEKTE